MKTIPYGRQNINQDDIDAVVNVLKSDFLTLLFLPISFLAVCQSIFKKGLKQK